ncbi:MAG: hypothetical protein AABW83_03435 [Nanoarchaeota archaeon]
MGYDFKIYRGDIILDIGNSSRNYGRDFIVQMPIVCWYAYKQFGHGNLFQQIELPDSISKLEEVSTNKLNNLIDSVIHTSLKLPKSLKGENGVNTDLNNWGISEFRGADNDYKMVIRKDSLDILEDGKLDVSISDYALLMKFCPSYFRFIGDWDEMSPFRQTIKNVYERLKDEI